MDEGRQPKQVGVSLEKHAKKTDFCCATFLDLKAIKQEPADSFEQTDDISGEHDVLKCQNISPAREVKQQINVVESYSLKECEVLIEKLDANSMRFAGARHAKTESTVAHVQRGAGMDESGNPEEIYGEISESGKAECSKTTDRTEKDAEFLAGSSADTEIIPQKKSEPSLNERQECEDCGKFYNTVAGIRRHRKFACVAKNERDRKMVECKKCKRRMPRYALKKHKYQHRKELLVMCPDCGQYMHKKSFKETHSCKEEKVTCKKCNPHVTMLANRLEKHVKTMHNSKPEDFVTCSLCGKKVHHLSLFDHMHRHRRPDRNRTYTCPHCGKTWIDSRSMRKHVALIHDTDREKFVCRKCERKFLTKAELKSHVDVLHKKKLSCKLCPKYFMTKVQLVDHQNFHEGKFPYQCEHCPQEKFCEKRNWQKHMYVKHSRRSTVCNICGRKFATSGSMLRHQLTHNDVRPFPCLVCHQRFSQKNSMLRHLLNLTLGRKADYLSRVWCRFQANVSSQKPSGQAAQGQGIKSRSKKKMLSGIHISSQRSVLKYFEDLYLLRTKFSGALLVRCRC